MKVVSGVGLLNELETNAFDYSLVDPDVSQSLQFKAYKINQITTKSAFDIGKELKEAQEKLADHGYGFFEEWYRSLGFKKTKAYEYINHYNFVCSQSERTKIEMFENLPKSLQSEVSKPSAKKELTESVLNGDIKTHKEYKEIEQLKNRPVETIERNNH